MQKYVLVKFIEEIEDGNEYLASRWPLHVTVVSNFAVDLSEAELIKKLSKILAKQKSIQVAAYRDEYFGPESQKRVTVLDVNDKLIALHKQLVAMLKDEGAAFDEPEYIEDGYRAHATVQPTARLYKDDIVDIDTLTLVDMFPDDDAKRRKTLHTFKLTR